MSFSTNGQNFNSLTLAGAAGTLVNLTGALNVGSTLSIGTANSLDIGANAFGVSSLSNLGTIYLTGTNPGRNIATIDFADGTFVYYGGGGTIFSSTFGPTSGYHYFNLSIGDATAGHSATGTFVLETAIAVAGSISITSGGTLDVTAVDYPITVGGNWSDTGTFNPETGQVAFTGASQNPVMVSGNNSWYIFDCETSAYSISVYFEDDKTQTINQGGIFKILGSSSYPIILSRQTPDQTTDLGWNPLSGAPDAALMWQINLSTTPDATLDMAYVTVKYSDARSHPVGVPGNVTVFYTNTAVAPNTNLTCYEWISGILAVNSYTEDSDHDGKIDRIRVVAETTLNGDFSGFSAVVNGYTIDTAKGTNGFALVAPTDVPPPQHLGAEFFIYLKEKPYNDTSILPSWYISANTSLKDAAQNKYELATIASPMVPASCAPPVIAYTLALPGSAQVFYHFSGPVYDAGPAMISAGDFTSPLAAGVAPVTGSGIGVSEALATYGSALTAGGIAAAPNYTVSAAVNDDTSAPHDYSTDPVWLSLGRALPAPFNYYMNADLWPNTIYSTTHRVSDVLISVPMVNATDTTYFVWPIYAKDQIQLSLTDAQIAELSPAQTAAEGIGLIRAFDGSQWLRVDDITVQALLQGTLSAYPVSLWFDSNVPSSLQSNGLWLPAFSESGFSGLVPYPDASPSGRGASYSQGTSIGSSLWNFTLPRTDPRIVSISDLGFFFTLQAAPLGATPLYVARLDITAGTTIPSDWYRLVKPFAFEIHDVRLQVGGVTILNNVIDPTKGQTARLTYQLSGEGSVTVTVFSLDGDVVKRLVVATQGAGDYAVDWDGRNMGGTPVARGIYFIRVVAPGIDEIRKVLVVRN
ncbi:MAG: FlgD immunoglobulin-like domain containing protein [Rectinemataceae bacterium]